MGPVDGGESGGLIRRLRVPGDHAWGRQKNRQIRHYLVATMKVDMPVARGPMHPFKKGLILSAGILFSLFSSSWGQGQVTKVGTSAANFLQMELGAKAVAMGGAFVGLANDVTTLYWNPAGAAMLDGLRVSYMEVSLYAGIRHQFSGVVVPIPGVGTIGVSGNHVDCGEMDVTTIEEPEGTGERFSASDLALAFSYSRMLTDRVSFGVTAKYIQEKIWLETATGYAFDFGTLYRISDSGVKIGMAITNFGPEMGVDKGPHLTFEKEPPENYPASPPLEARYETKKFPLPVRFELGVALDAVGGHGLLMKSLANQVTLVGAINDGFDAPFRSTWGVEYEWGGIIALRGGYRENYDTGGISVGAGLNVPVRPGLSAEFDYAWVDYGDLDDIQIWSLELKF